MSATTTCGRRHYSSYFPLIHPTIRIKRSQPSKLDPLYYQSCHLITEIHWDSPTTTTINPFTSSSFSFESIHAANRRSVYQKRTKPQYRCFNLVFQSIHNDLNQNSTAITLTDLKSFRSTYHYLIFLSPLPGNHIFYLLQFYLILFINYNIALQFVYFYKKPKKIKQQWLIEKEVLNLKNKSQEG